MNEYVFTVIGREKAETLFGVVELDLAGWHLGAPLVGCRGSRKAEGCAAWDWHSYFAKCRVYPQFEQNRDDFRRRDSCTA